MTAHPLARDLDQVLERTAGLWPELAGQRLFITGGTGFFGCWLLESLAWANRRLGLKAHAVVLTRQPEAFRRRMPQLSTDPSIALVAGDVRSFAFPSGQFAGVIHAATPVSTPSAANDPLDLADIIVGGTWRTLQFAARCQARSFLLTSSGAVYGRQPPELSHISEGYLGGPDCTDAACAYAEGKRLAELLCCGYARQSSLPAKIARCFAFVGPYLPLDGHFAIGNFIRDGLTGGFIRISGDGTPVRSYLYAADLAVWLWTILFRGRPGRAYNVGSDQPCSIRQLAEQVRDVLAPTCSISVAAKPMAGREPERYVPSIARARAELGLEVRIPLAEAIERTGEFARQGTLPG